MPGTASSKNNPISDNDLPTVKTTLNYQHGSGVFYRLAQDQNKIVHHEHEVVIRDARPVADQLDLDRDGFILVNCPSKIFNPIEEGPARELYNREIANLVNGILGVSNGIVFQTAIRDGANAGKVGVRQPIFLAHNDYTQETWARVVHDPLDAISGNADQLLAGNWAVINVWRPLAPIVSEPLAVCHAASVEADDYLPNASLETPDDISVPYYGNPLAFKARHRWFYFSDMTPEELIIFPQCDTREGRLGATAHTAFADPNTPPGTPPRKSIETRVFVSF